MPLHFKVVEFPYGGKYASIEGLGLEYIRSVLLEYKDGIFDGTKYELKNMDLAKVSCMWIFNAGAKLYSSTERGNIIMGYDNEGTDVLSAVEEFKGAYYAFLSNSHLKTSRKISGYTH